MAARRKSTDKHIAITPHGFRASIRIRGELHQKRFRKDTPILKIKEWVLKTEMKYRRGSPTSGRFVDDALRYLEAVRAMPTFEQRAQHINEWIAVFDTQRRDEIAVDQISAQLHRWRTEPRTLTKRGGKTVAVILSAASVNKRRSALMHLFTTLDGKVQPNPVKDTPKFREPDPPPRAIPFPLLHRLFAVMPDSKSKARLMVIAYTGIPHAQLAQIQATDVDMDRRVVAVAGRRKGAGTQGRIVPLIPDAVRAFKAMAREGAWGTFSRATLRIVFQRACKAAGLGTGFTPYDLRHSFGTEVYRRSGDIRATQKLLDHSTPQLTHRYTVAAEDPRVAAAIATFGRVGNPTGAKRAAKVAISKQMRRKAAKSTALSRR